MSELEAIDRESKKLPPEADFQRRSLLSAMCVGLGSAKAKAAAEYTLELVPIGSIVSIVSIS